MGPRCYGVPMPSARKGVELGDLLDRVDALVQAHGAVPRAQMRTFRRHLPELESGLVLRGHEVGSTIRRPLEMQILALAETGFVPAKGLPRRVAGATARELRETMSRLVARGALVQVVRQAGPGWSLPSAELASEQELREWALAVTALQKLLRKAKPGKKTALRVLRDDLCAPLSALLIEASTSEPPSQAVPAPAPSPAREALAREIERRVRGASRPLRVPDLIRSLGVPVEEGQRALLDGASRGLFQLEPESGMGRLSREEAYLCPPGPMGTRLSWVRVRATPCV